MDANTIYALAAEHHITIRSRSRVDGTGTRRQSGGWVVSFAGGRCYTYGGTLTEVAERLGLIGRNWVVVAPRPDMGTIAQGAYELLAECYTQDEAEQAADVARQHEVSAAAWGCTPREIVVISK